VGRWGNHELRVYRKIPVGEQDAWLPVPLFSGVFTIFERTVEWAVGRGIETATFHTLTPYPGTGLYARTRKAGRIVHSPEEPSPAPFVPFPSARKR
jgi:hypothetical protein